VVVLAELRECQEIYNHPLTSDEPHFFSVATTHPSSSGKDIPWANESIQRRCPALLQCLLSLDSPRRDLTSVHPSPLGLETPSLPALSPWGSRQITILWIKDCQHKQWGLGRQATGKWTQWRFCPVAEHIRSGSSCQRTTIQHDGAVGGGGQIQIACRLLG
jgi:hypothetical protein